MFFRRDRPAGDRLSCFSLLFVVYLIKVYIKLVVIVNDQFTVDKKSFLHKISGLRQRELAGQGLYPACTDVEEKTAGLQKSRFCTSDPVHIQRLFHR